jgi:hypothetical protein
MTDIVGFIIWILSAVLKRLLFGYALCRGVIYAIKDKRLGDYFYSLGIGNDIFGNKLIAPYANRHFIKPGGRRYGQNETISLTMAINKRDGYNTKEADFWERCINIFDDNHLEKTLLKNNNNLN